MLENQLSYISSRFNKNSKFHAIQAKLDRTVDIKTLTNNFLSIVRDLFGMEQQYSNLFLWVEKHNYLSNSEFAEQLVKNEMDRPLNDESKFPLRAVLLTFSDDFSFLIIVANHAYIDKSSMIRMLNVCITGHSITIDEATTSEKLAIDNPNYVSQILTADFLPKSYWKFNSCMQSPPIITTEWEIQKSGQFIESYWITALIVVLSRIYCKKSPVIALNTSFSLSTSKASLLVRDGYRLITSQIERNSVAEEQIPKIANWIEESLVWYTDELFDGMFESEDLGDVLVGVLINKKQEKPVNQILSLDYNPFFSLPFPLTLDFQKCHDEKVILKATFETKIFPPTIVNDIIECMKTCYEAIQRNKNLCLSRYPLLNNSQAEAVLNLIPRVKVPFANDLRIDQMISNQAQSYPDSIALSFGKQQMTYRELETASNQMAHRLIKFGVKINERVGICIDRSLEMVVSIIAVLKSGAGYVPMDPENPKDRLKYICNDAGIRVVICTREDFPTSDDFILLHPNELSKPEADSNLLPPALALTSSKDTAYVIYTSGTTGSPKGVEIPHGNLTSLVSGLKTDFKLSKNDIWTLFHSVAFDFSVWEMFGCLLTGGQLVIVPQWITLSSEAFSRLIFNKRVTILSQTPSAFAQLVDIDRKQTVSNSLKLIVFGGEQLDATMLLSWFDRHFEHQCRLVNMYGITETTVHVTAQTVTRNEAINASKSVGSAIPGWYFYVLDENQNLLPLGVPGEIYVGGAGIAKKYLNQPKLTAEKFLKDPFHDGVFYRSGDCGRLLQNGHLEHLGRLDNQIKLRGYRIELDEIRSVILRIQGVVSVAVLVNQPDKNDTASARLDCYLVLDGISVKDVKLLAERFLPSYMVPSTFTKLDSFPLTTNNKLDARKLPVPATNNSSVVNTKGGESTSRSEMPTSHATDTKQTLQQTMVKIWSQIFKVNVHIDDNFFDLGGNSLLAMRISSLMKEQGLPSLLYRDLYIHQTISNICLFMSNECEQNGAVLR